MTTENLILDIVVILIIAILMILAFAVKSRRISTMESLQKIHDLDQKQIESLTDALKKASNQIKNMRDEYSEKLDKLKEKTINGMENIKQCEVLINKYEKESHEITEKFTKENYRLIKTIQSQVKVIELLEKQSPHLKGTGEFARKSLKKVLQKKDSKPNKDTSDEELSDRALKVKEQVNEPFKEIKENPEINPWPVIKNKEDLTNVMMIATLIMAQKNYFVEEHGEEVVNKALQYIQERTRSYEEPK